MKKTYKTLLIYILIAILLFLSGLTVRILSPEHPITPYPTSKIEKTVLTLQNNMINLLSQINFDSIESHEELWFFLDSLKRDNIDILVFQEVELVGWTNHFLPLDGLTPNYFFQKLVFLENGWYLAQHRQNETNTIVALYLLKHEYPYQNNLLQDVFSANFPLENDAKILRNKVENSFPILDENCEPLFYILPGISAKNFSKGYVISSWLFLAAFISILIFFFRLLHFFSEAKEVNIVLFVAIIFFSLIYYLTFWKAGLTFLNGAEIFSPFNFAMSDFLPSLGFFLLLSAWLFIITFWFYRFFCLPKLFKTQKGYKLRTIILFVIFLLSALFFLVLINRLFYYLALHSGNDLILTRIINIEWVSMSKILISALLLFSFLLYYRGIIDAFLKELATKHIIFWLLITTIPFLLYYSGIGVSDSDWSFLFFIVLGLYLVYSDRKSEKQFSYRKFLWISVIFAIYAGIILLDLNIRQEETRRELLIENLSYQLVNNEDPIGEMYLIEIEKQLIHDAALFRLMTQSDLNPEVIKNHLQKYFFYGYWGRYELQVIPCIKNGNLYIEDTGEERNCYLFFQELIAEYGYLIDGSNHFHYLDKRHGKVSFLGVFPFFDDNQNEISLFIELQSKPYSEGMGYPELLISNKEQARMRIFDNYSYAKYVNGILVKSSGSYIYKNSAKSFHPVLHGKIFQKEDIYSHLLFQPDARTIIVMTKTDLSFEEVFMAFSIFFIFFFLFSILFIIFSKLKFNNLKFNISIQKQMQTGFVALLMLMLIIVAIRSIYYSVKQFEHKHYELLENKIQSLLLELEYKIGFEQPETNIPVDYLNYQLQMISSLFHCDINIYGIEGKLIGTSRQELFRNGLMGTQMNSKAYFSLVYTEAARFFEEEQIGNLKYTSFYVPLLSDNNLLIGFVNLPYFVGNDELKNEISSVIVTIINFYLIFSLLVITIAVFLSHQITKPLLMLQSKLSQLKFDRHNEKIDYKRKDEIGELVSEYNRMVDALSVSAEKLARSERELAWREMAKQIAHEIKNPLTPMKLSIQHLQRAWKDNPLNFDAFLKRVTATLIEQIDNLSSIASEFGNFAQMPNAKLEIVNLTEKVESSLLLFQNTTNIPIIYQNNVGNNVFVNADGEQLPGVFNNLIKNAIQAIPNEKEGIIKVTIDFTPEQHVKVTISDNGKGISEEVKNNLFVPNFTTKSGGMGLGLAISRRIVESAGGKIWFESTEGIGATFCVELKLLEDK